MVVNFSMSKSAELLAEIRAGAVALGIAPTTLCQRAVRNAQLPRRLMEGQSVTVDTMETIREYIRTRRAEKDDPGPSYGDFR